MVVSGDGWDDQRVNIFIQEYFLLNTYGGYNNEGTIN